MWWEGGRERVEVAKKKKRKKKKKKKKKKKTRKEKGKRKKMKKKIMYVRYDTKCFVLFLHIHTYSVHTYTTHTYEYIPRVLSEGGFFFFFLSPPPPSPKKTKKKKNSGFKLTDKPKLAAGAVEYIVSYVHTYPYIP